MTNLPRPATVSASRRRCLSRGGGIIQSGAGPSIAAKSAANSHHRERRHRCIVAKSSFGRQTCRRQLRVGAGGGPRVGRPRLRSSETKRSAEVLKKCSGRQAPTAAPERNLAACVACVDCSLELSHLSLRSFRAQETTRRSFKSFLSCTASPHAHLDSQRRQVFPCTAPPEAPLDIQVPP